jgi:hypothetical protein
MLRDATAYNPLVPYQRIVLWNIAILVSNPVVPNVEHEHCYS